MKKNIAVSLKILRSGDAKAIKKMGLQKLTATETAQRNADENAYDEYAQKDKYKDDRAVAYPPVTDQLDAIWKTLDFLLDGKQYPAAVTELREQVRAVKNQFSKPKRDN